MGTLQNLGTVQELCKIRKVLSNEKSVEYNKAIEPLRTLVHKLAYPESLFLPLFSASLNQKPGQSFPENLLLICCLLV